MRLSMDAGKKNKARGLLEEYLDFPDTLDRRTWLEQACSGDDELRREVERLAGLDEKADAVFAQSRGIGIVDGLLRWAASAERTSGEDSDLATEEFPPGDGNRPEIDGYQIGELLGEGGMGRVYRALQLSTGREVAVKVIRPEMAAGDVRLRFEDEKQNLARMSHPGIAAIFDAGQAKTGEPYFVMEYVRGEPITKFCDAGRLRVRDRLRLFVDVCQAIEHAHAKGIIHRDIKPSNILVIEEDGRATPKVIDFGLARALDPEVYQKESLTRPGTVFCTPEYMSPEQATEPLSLDRRTDVYSLGAVLYELLAGVPPFPFGSWPAFLPLLLKEDPPPPSTVLGDSQKAQELTANRGTTTAALRRLLGGELSWILLKALKKDRDDRYATAADLARDVERYLNDEPVQAARPSLGYRAKKFIRRHPWEVGAAGVLLLLAVSLLLVEQYMRWSRFWTTVDEARQAIDAGEFNVARSRLGALEQQDRDHAQTDNVYRQLVDEVLARAKKSRDKYLHLRTQAEKAKEKWEEEKDRPNSKAPVWVRQRELEAWDEFKSRQTQAGEEYDKALRLAQQGLTFIRPSSPDDLDMANDLIGEMLWIRREEALEKGAIEEAPERFENAIRSYDSKEYVARLDKPERISITTDPAGADVYCFKYEQQEGRLVPLPFSPSQGIVGEFFLQVEKVWDESLSGVPTAPGTFEAGDRILEINGRTDLRSFRDFATAVSGLSEGQAVAVRARRNGREIAFDWVPFLSEVGDRLAKAEVPGFQRDKVFSSFHQLGFNLSAYPLEFREENLVGRTKEDSALEVGLGPGSYVFVLRKEGFTEARLPVSVPLERVGTESGASDIKQPRVKLLRKELLPSGFVYIPEGYVATGGDSDAFQPLERDYRLVPPFLIARHEVTIGEWLQFVNDYEMLSAIDSIDGTAQPRFASFKVPPNSLQLIPKRSTGELRIKQEDGLWGGNYSAKALSWPIFYVTRDAALEYAAWRTHKAKQRGEPWKFRLPTDEEWERAARGVDRRKFVWGDYLVWSFCWSYHGRIIKGVEVVGISPFDESPFGIRDMSGSVTEYTLAETLRGFAAYRGGGFTVPDEYFYHVATRNGVSPGSCFQYSGLRLAADIPEQERGGPPDHDGAESRERSSHGK